MELFNLPIEPLVLKILNFFLANVSYKLLTTGLTCAHFVLGILTLHLTIMTIIWNSDSTSYDYDFLGILTLRLTIMTIIWNSEYTFWNSDFFLRIKEFIKNIINCDLTIMTFFSLTIQTCEFQSCNWKL